MWIGIDGARFAKLERFRGLIPESLSGEDALTPSPRRIDDCALLSSKSLLVSASRVPEVHLQPVGRPTLPYFSVRHRLIIFLATPPYGMASPEPTSNSSDVV